MYTTWKKFKVNEILFVKWRLCCEIKPYFILFFSNFLTVYLKCIFQTANIIFLDYPVGAGFTYATTYDAWTTTDILSATQTYEFLRNVCYFYILKL